MPGVADHQALTSGATFSYELVQLLFIQVLHHLTYVLRVLPGRDQQCVRGFHYHKIIHTHSRDKFSRSMHIVAAGVQSKYSRAGYDVTV